MKNVSVPVRLRAARRGLELLRQLAKRPSTFARYGGHLLLAFYFIATTSHDGVLRRTALAAGRERARHWKRQWRLKPRRLDARTVFDETCASYAAERLAFRIAGFDTSSRPRSRVMNRASCWVSILGSM